MRVLLIETHSERAAEFTLALTARDAVVDVADSVEEATSLASVYDYDVVLSPQGAVRALRTARFNSAIIVFSETYFVNNLVRALGDGADDYMVHPINFDELFARMMAIVLRYRDHVVSLIDCGGGLVVDTDAQMVTVHGKPVHTTKREYQMLELFAMRRGQCLTKEAFFNHLYGGIDEPEIKIVEVFICKLRKKLRAAGADVIETVWGRGYMLRRDTLPLVESPPLQATADEAVAA